MEEQSWKVIKKKLEKKIIEKLDGDIDMRRIAKNRTAYLQLDAITEDQRL